MKRLIAVLLIVLLPGLLIFFIVKQQAQVIPQVPAISSIQQGEDSELQARVNMARGNTAPSDVSVVLVKEISSVENTVTIRVQLEAQEYTVFDAVDLGLKFVNSVNKPACEQGNAVPLYPHFAVTPEGITIIGTATIADKHILFGNSNHTLVTCTFTKNQNTEVVLDLENTHVYSLGVDIFNAVNSTKHIKL